jgi:hypothetical protein
VGSRANSAFQQSVSGADCLELFKAPFEEEFAEISERPLFLSSKGRKLFPQSLADAKADLGLPFPHPVPLLSATQPTRKALNANAGFGGAGETFGFGKRGRIAKN